MVGLAAAGEKRKESDHAEECRSRPGHVLSVREATAGDNPPDLLVTGESGAASPRVVPRPAIVWKPIPFGAKRKAETAAYAKRHYEALRRSARPSSRACDSDVLTAYRLGLRLVLHVVAR